MAGSGSFALQNTVPLPVMLTVGGNSANSTYSGALTGGGSLFKTGSGNLTLTGSSNFSGGATVNSGSLTFDAQTNSGYNLGTGPIVVNSSGVMNFNNSSEVKRTGFRRWNREHQPGKRPVGQS